MFIKGLLVAVPTLGRISIGFKSVVNNKSLPVRADEFQITTNLRDKDGQWITHPIQQSIEGTSTAEQKLREIPVKLMFNSPELNLSAMWSVFEQSKGRAICVGDGEKASRVGANSHEEIECKGPDYCAFGRDNRCKLYGRLQVHIEGQTDPFSAFVLRTTGFNSVRTLAAKLQHLHALTAGKIAGMPLLLKLRAKCASASMGTPFYYADLDLRDGMSIEQAASEARNYQARMAESGLDFAGYEAAVLRGYRHVSMFDLEDDLNELDPTVSQQSAQSINGTKQQPTQITKQNIPPVAGGGLAQIAQDALIYGDENFDLKPFDKGLHLPTTAPNNH